METEGCYCKHRPTCEKHPHHDESGTCALHGHISLNMAKVGMDGPPCIWDNAPTQRAGSCFVCVMCGSSTSC